MVRFNFKNSSPVTTSLEELSVVQSCLARSADSLSPVDRAIAIQLEKRLAGIKADMVKRQVGVKY